MRIRINKQKLDKQAEEEIIEFEGTMFGFLQYSNRHKPQYWILRDIDPKTPQIPQEALKLPHTLVPSCHATGKKCSEYHYDATELKYRNARVYLMYNGNSDWPAIDSQTLDDFNVFVTPGPYFFNGNETLLRRIGVEIV